MIILSGGVKNNSMFVSSLLGTFGTHLKQIFISFLFIVHSPLLLAQETLSHFEFLEVIEELKISEPSVELTQDLVEFKDYNLSQKSKLDKVVNTFYERLDVVEQHESWERWFELKAARGFPDLMEAYAIQLHLIYESGEEIRQKIFDADFDRFFNRDINRAYRWTRDHFFDWRSETIQKLSSHDPQDRKVGLGLLLSPSSSHKIRAHFLKKIFLLVPEKFRPLVMGDILNNDTIFREDLFLRALAKKMAEPEWIEHPRLVAQFIHRLMGHPMGSSMFVNNMLVHENWARAQIPLYVGEETAPDIINRILEGSEGLTLLEQAMHLNPYLLAEILSTVLTRPEFSDFLYKLDAIIEFGPKLGRIYVPAVMIGVARVLVKPHAMAHPDWAQWMEKMLKIADSTAMDFFLRSEVFGSEIFLKNPHLMKPSLLMDERMNPDIERIWMEKLRDTTAFEALGIATKRTVYCQQIY